MKLRCSSLDRLFACPASIHTETDETLIDHEPSEATNVGLAVHALMADVLRNRYQTLPDVAPYAQQFGVEEREVRILGYQGMKVLGEYRRYLSEEPEIEESLRAGIADGLELTGRADVMDYVADDGGTVYVLDWKTGDKDEDSRYLWQMRGYGYLGLQSFDDRQPSSVVVILAWLRSGETSVFRYRVDGVNRLPQEIAQQLEWDGKTYTPGDACRYCPRVAACPGRRDLMLAAVEVLTSERRASLVPFNGDLVDPSAFGRSIVQARFLKQLCEDHLRQCVEAVRSLGGDVPLPSGQHVVIKSRAGRATLKSHETVAALDKRFGLLDTDTVLDMATLSKDAVETFVASKATRGEKKALKEDVFRELEEIGALTRGGAVEWVEVRNA
jgi:hypothetical protein